MKFSTPTLRTLALLSSLLTSSATAAPINNKTISKRDCLVNNRQIDRWHEAGQNRWRVAFSSANTPTEAYCDIWAHTYPLFRGESLRSRDTQRCDKYP